MDLQETQGEAGREQKSLCSKASVKEKKILDIIRYIREWRLENPVCQAHGTCISQVQMCAPEHAAVSSCSQQLLPSLGQQPLT